MHSTFIMTDLHTKSSPHLLLSNRWLLCIFISLWNWSISGWFLLTMIYLDVDFYLFGACWLFVITFFSFLFAWLIIYCFPGLKYKGQIQKLHACIQLAYDKCGGNSVRCTVFSQNKYIYMYINHVLNQHIGLKRDM